MKFKNISAGKGLLRYLTLLGSIVLVTLFFRTGMARAHSTKVINIEVDEALKSFSSKVQGGKEFLKNSKGILVFPSIAKAGFVVGGEYGEGALRVKGKTVGYYSTVAASIGFQIGAQSKTLILVFMEQTALDSFRKSEGWEVGVDGSVALVSVGAGGSVDTTNLKDPIVAFVFDQKGLMVNLTLEGSKFTKIKK